MAEIEEREVRFGAEVGTRVTRLTRHGFDNCLEDLAEDWNKNEGIKGKLKLENEGAPVMAQQKQIRLVSMRMRVRSLVLPSGWGMGIWLCCELWCRLQMQLGSGVAVAVV